MGLDDEERRSNALKARLEYLRLHGLRVHVDGTIGIRCSNADPQDAKEFYIRLFIAAGGEAAVESTGGSSIAMRESRKEKCSQCNADWSMHRYNGLCGVCTERRKELSRGE